MRRQSTSQIGFSVFQKRGIIVRALALTLILLFSCVAPSSPADAACALPNQITNGQPADATAVMRNFNALKECADAAIEPTGAPVVGNLAAFSGAKSVTNGDLVGDCVTSGSLSVTCTKTNGALLGYFATGTDAAELSGTISVNRFNNGANADTSHFLRGDGVWATPPSGGSGGSRQPWFLAYKPATAEFTAVSGDATSPILADDSDEGLLFDLGAIVNGDKWRGAEKIIMTPAADWAVTAKVETLTPAIAWRGAGLYIRDGVGGRIVSFDRYNGDNLEVTRWMSLSGTWHSRLLDLPNVGNHTGWYRITYTAADNTYRFYYSITGKNWALLATELQTTFLTNKANRIGFGGWHNGSSGPNTVGAVQYWTQSW